MQDIAKFGTLVVVWPIDKPAGADHSSIRFQFDGPNRIDALRIAGANTSDKSVRVSDAFVGFETDILRRLRVGSVGEDVERVVRKDGAKEKALGLDGLDF